MPTSLPHHTDGEAFSAAAAMLEALRPEHHALVRELLTTPAGQAELLAALNDAAKGLVPA